MDMDNSVGLTMGAVGGSGWWWAEGGKGEKIRTTIIEQQ